LLQHPLAMACDGCWISLARTINPLLTSWYHAHMPMSTLTPILALIAWTFVLWFWMYATRIPAMRAAGLDPWQVSRKQDMDVLPQSVQQIRDNYHHLHEQPTVFYALALYSHVAGTADATNVMLAWSYVGLRILHSLIQCTHNFIPLRFTVFALASLVIMAMTARNVIALIPVSY
jgi:hypothetical protein